MPLSRETFDKITDLLVPQALTEQERIALLTRAFTGSPIRYNINASVAPQVFVTHLIEQCADYLLEPDQTALWVMLETVRGDVGVDKQTRIDALRGEVNIIAGAPAAHTADGDPYAPYRADVLFLLIGRNPLPNYVAAQHLVKPDGKIYLVHTEGKHGTGETAESLRRYIGAKRCELVGVPPLEPDVIYRKIHNLMPANAARIGLNYTGGTKIMAIQAYRALQDRRTVYSYLDADTLQLVFEGDHTPVDAMANNLAISFYELLEIHGWPKGCGFETEPAHPDRVEPSVEAGKDAQAGLIDWALTCIPDGYWRARNLTLKGRAQLEIDVAFMKGYQLIALACAPTQDAEATKLSFLETTDAARRLGGDEACVGLVSLLSNPDGLKRQLADQLEARPDRIRIFGRPHLPGLAEELQYWLEDMEGNRYG